MKLGILGGGQLARMLALAADPLGIHTICIDPNPEACAKDVTKVITAEFTDESALHRFQSAVDVVTYETENIPLSCAGKVAKERPLYPSLETLRIAQDRLHEKTFFKSLQIPTPGFFPIGSESELSEAVIQAGLPSMLKTRRMGYDGKGQRLLKTFSDISESWNNLQNQELILEEFIRFEFETSLISVRNKQGDIRFYPLTRNEHRHGILRSSEAPLHNDALVHQAQSVATQVLETLDYVGVLAIEFFYDGQRLLVNEMAPRVHNSGHWTIEGAQTSQFENHLRAVLILPLGSTEALGQVFMRNCVGECQIYSPVYLFPALITTPTEKHPAQTEN